MSSNDFKPGDLVQHPERGRGLVTEPDHRPWVEFAHGTAGLEQIADNIRRIVAIDPEDREQIERLRDLMDAAWVDQGNGLVEARTRGARGNAVQAALREFASPMPEQPADPTARVVDCRDNYWRLLADGDWVCVDGPDSGEYLAWTGLAARGPLTIFVEGVQV